MCTLTIHRTEDSLLLTMNRDESRKRPDERPPEITLGDPSWIGPRDGPSEGTWCAVNEHGIAACLLNRYLPGDEAKKGKKTPSRGGLVPLAMERDSFFDAMKWLTSGLDPQPYPSFRLIVASLDGVVSFGWDGKERAEIGLLEKEWEMVTSSSWRGEEVIAWRESKFDEWMNRGSEFDGRIPAFNLLRIKGKESWCPMMSRDYARTRSVTQLSVSEDESLIRYWPVLDGDPLHLSEGVSRTFVSDAERGG